MIAAIVPAAGLSLRMGRPKLILDLGGTPVIVRVVRALLDGGTDRVYVVVPPTGQDGAGQIRELVETAGARAVVLPSATPDMRASIEHGLRVIVEELERPMGVLVAPGDAIGMSARVVSAVLAKFRSDPSRIVVPRREGLRAHPLALPWDVALSIFALPLDSGVNVIVRDRADLVDVIVIDEPGPDSDLDTPEDYARLTREGL